MLGSSGAHEVRGAYNRTMPDAGQFVNEYKDSNRNDVG
jgi:hypothetical protein